MLISQLLTLRAAMIGLDLPGHQISRDHSIGEK
jgi:hypothetical protein